MKDKPSEDPKKQTKPATWAERFPYGTTYYHGEDIEPPEHEWHELALDKQPERK